METLPPQESKLITGSGRGALKKNINLESSANFKSSTSHWRGIGNEYQFVVRSTYIQPTGDKMILNPYSMIFGWTHTTPMVST